MDRLREWELAERAAVAAERLAANLDGIDSELDTVRHAREKARRLREKADDLMAEVVHDLGKKAPGMPPGDPTTGGGLPA